MSGIHFKIDSDTVRTIVEEWRRQQERREEADKRRYDLLFQTLAPYAPMLVNLFTDKPSERDPLLAAFMNTITPDQISKLAPLLTTEQMAMVMQFVDKYIPPEEVPKEETEKPSSCDEASAKEKN